MFANRQPAVSSELQYSDVLPFGMPAQNRLQEILPHNISEASLLTDQKLFEMQIPTGDISKVMSKNNAPRLNFTLSQTSTSAGVSGIVLNRSAAACIYSLEVFHGSQRLVNIQEFDRVYNTWLDLVQSTGHTDFEKGCVVKTTGGYDFGEVALSTTKNAKFSLDILGFLGEMTHKAIPLGLFKNAPLYLRVVFNKRARMTATAATNVSDLRVNNVSLTYNELVLDSSTYSAVFGSDLKEMRLDTTGFETTKKIIGVQTSDATLIPTNATSLKGLLTCYYENDLKNDVRINPYAQSGSYQFKLGGDYHPNMLVQADTLFTTFSNEVRKVKGCVKHSSEDSLVDYKGADFVIGADLSVYTTCGKVIAGVNTVGRDLQHIQNFGTASTTGTEIFNVVIYDAVIVIENGQARLEM